MRVVTALLGAGLCCVLFPACSDELPVQTTAVPSIVPLSLPDSTDPPLADSVPADAEGVISWIIAEVSSATLYQLDEDEQRCVRARLLQDVGRPLLAQVQETLDLDNNVSDAQRTAVLRVFDECVALPAFVAQRSPSMVAAGVPSQVADCVATKLRTELGFTGLYALARSVSGERDQEETTLDQAEALYRSCGLDPDSLTPASILPPATAG